MEPRRIAIGQIVAPRGIKGEVRVLPLTDFPDRFKTLRRAFLGAPWNSAVEVEGARFHQGMALVKIRGIDTRDEAEKLRDVYLEIEEADLVPLGKDEYYLFQIVGLRVFTEEGRALGEVVDVLRTGPNDVYVVRESQPADPGETPGAGHRPGTPGAREYLIPAVKEFITGVDLQGKKLVVRPIPGLLD